MKKIIMKLNQIIMTIKQMNYYQQKINNKIITLNKKIKLKILIKKKKLENNKKIQKKTQKKIEIILNLL